MWWGYANGVPREAPGSIDLSPSWSWPPLEEIVQECREMRAIGSEGVVPDEPSLFEDAWLPIVVGDGMLVIDTSEPVVAPVYAVDLDPDVPPHAKTALTGSADRSLDARARDPGGLV